MVTSETLDQISYASANNKPISIKTYTFLPKAQNYIDHFLQAYLDELGIPQIMDQLSYCLKELAVNAKKANTKRIYFQERGLNLDNPGDYDRGMRNFKTDTLSNQSHYLTRLKELDLYIKIEFLKYQGYCTVAVKNNSTLLPWEMDRIQEKIAKARRYATLEDAFEEVLDDSEGAGLGILVLVLMLRNVGFEGDFFQVYAKGNETVARIILPACTDSFIPDEV